MLDTGEPCVYLDITQKPADQLRERFPGVYAVCLERGIDMTRQPIPVVPAAHYSCGGIATDEWGRTTVDRLRAAGEVACTGLHGANRLASTSLLECLVWGTRAGAAAAEAIWAAATTNQTSSKTAVGFGGGHYCNKHCSALREDGYAFSHIFSKYFFDDYDPSIVRMAYDRTMGRCETAVIDWKGLRGPERAKLLDDLQQMKIEVVRV
jgi:succinate dehydrogenase/fumarate reductase flavoprotein subunit